MVKPSAFTEKILGQCMAAFKKVYANYLDEFGVSDQLQDIIVKENEIMVLKIDLSLTGDQFLNTMIQIREAELTELKKINTTKTNTAKIAIEKWLGFRINEREVTVREYYDYLNTIQSNGR